MNLGRVLAVGAVAIVPAALALAVPGTSNAAPKTITCSSVSGTIATQKLAGCTGGSTLGATATVTKAGALITWSAKGGGTDTNKVASDKELTGKSDTCKAPKGQTNSFLAEESGTISKGTGKGTALVGGKTSAKVCIFSKSLALYPGTKFSL
jgi:hypothetical protein